MTDEEKVALLLLSLPVEKTESVLTHIEPARRQRLRARIQTLRQAPQAPEVVDQLLREFDVLLKQKNAGAAAPPPDAGTTEKNAKEQAAAAETPAPPPP